MDRQIRQVDRQTRDKWTDTDRQIDRWTDRQTNGGSINYIPSFVYTILTCSLSSTTSLS